MLNVIQTKKIKNFQQELSKTKNLGFIHSYTDVKKQKLINYEKIGVEILFNDIVSDKQIKLIKDYIETTYQFYVDDSTLNEYGKLPRIIIVWYYD